MARAPRAAEKRGIPVQSWIVFVSTLLLVSVALSSLAMAQTPDHSRDELRKLNQSVDSLIKKVSPSVVQILVTGYGPLEEGEHGNATALIGRQRAIGSGFVIDPSGYIMTNAHVVNGAQRVQVVLPGSDASGTLDAALSTRTTVVPARIVGVARDIAASSSTPFPPGDYSWATTIHKVGIR